MDLFQVLITICFNSHLIILPEQQTEDTLKQRDGRIVDLEKSLVDAQALVARLEAQVREEETIRRRLHNTIQVRHIFNDFIWQTGLMCHRCQSQELKGNIRVFCRVRPLLEAEKESSDGGLAHMNFKENEEGAIELYQSVVS